MKIGDGDSTGTEGVALPPGARQSAGAALPVLLALLIATAPWVLHLGVLADGAISHYDEFFTLDRTTGFSRFDDWLTVYSVNEVSFRKPPLQYWISALLLEGGADPEFALRLPSMVFGLGTLAATALLVRAVAPRLPWAMPAAVLLCASSDQFWQYATSAMLDTGAAFFATLALAAAILARSRPGWWYVAAIAIGLGSFQKAPVGLALVAIYLAGQALLVDREQGGFRQVARLPQFRRAAWIAILATLAWPLFQTALHGIDAILKSFGGQMLARFAPTAPFTDPRSLAEIDRLIIAGEPLLRWPAIVALVLLPWLTRRRDLVPLPVLFAVFVAALLLAGGGVYPRYALIVEPLLMAALAIALHRLVSAPWLALCASVALSAANLGPVKTAEALGIHADPSLATKVSVLERFGTTLAPGETPVICNWQFVHRFFPGAVSVYGSKNRPFVILHRRDRIATAVAEGALEGRLRGLCRPEDLQIISQRLVGLETLDEIGGYLVWTATRAE